MRFNRQTIFSTVAVWLAIVGCAPVAVKEVTADKDSYLHKNFASGNISPKISSTITGADNGTASFQKMVLTITPHVEYQQRNSDLADNQTTLTLINAGGPFVQRIEELTSNKIATRQNFALMYRNFFTVRSQVVNLNNVNANQIYELKSLKSFSRLSTSTPGSGEFDYEYENAPTVQLVNFRTTHYHCKYLTSYAANTLSAKLTGDAQDLECQIINENGVAVNHSVMAVLFRYGITLMKRIETPTYTTTFKIDDVRIE